ncbi:heat shock protein beta-9 [Fukomys damarensis]|uniref:Heat shock protein beta-9 n=1 Tax=Fukomys damarensis TaxID=885580 RepID=A0A091D8S0_FUKDA|nr:heat shock protein beta-9 [Fukomys damarensis]KFO28529.1 Heat shock protein beta-9 [Fukomys damarensis]
MRRTGSRVSNDRGVEAPGPSAALPEPDQGTTLSVRLLRDTSESARDADHAQGFQVKMDAHGFAPEELQVWVDGSSLVVTGQRQEKHYDPRGVSYQLKQKVYRQVQLPGNLDPAATTCSLTPSGELWVRSPCRPLPLPEAPPGSSPSLTRQGSKKGSRPALASKQPPCAAARVCCLLGPVQRWRVGTGSTHLNPCHWRS